MKVILLGATPPPVGGIARWTVRMMKAELNNGWSINLIDEKVNTGREMFGDKTALHIWPEIKRWLIIWKALYLALKDPDAVVVHATPTAETRSLMAEYISCILTKLHKKAFIVHFRCTVPNMINGKFNKHILKKICDRSDMIISLNGQTESFLRSLTKTHIRTIPNFVSIDAIQNSHIINEKVKRICYVGGVIESKGCNDIISVAKKFPDIEFRLIGRPSTEMSSLAVGCDNVILTGVKDSEGVKEELQNADIFMFLSYYPGEGFSNALAEAMSEGLPCIVTDWAANADMIEDYKGGRVVSCKNPKMACDALVTMLPANVRKKQSEFNFSKAMNCYTEQKIIDAYVDCYETCIKNKRCLP